MANKTNDKLLREAVAEANQVREAAIANAKMALEEAFTPHLSEMFSEKLKNEMQDDAEDGHGRSAGEEPDYDVVQANEQRDLKSSDINAVDNKMPAYAARNSSDIDNPGQEVDKMGEATVGHDGHDPEGEDVTKRKSTHKSHGNLTHEHGNQFATANRSPFDAMYEDDEEDEDEFDLEDDDLDDIDLEDDDDDDDDDDMDFDLDDEDEDLRDIDLDLEAIIRELESELDDLSMDDDEFEMDEDISRAAKKIPAKQTVDGMGEKPDHPPAGEKRHVKLGEAEHDDEEEVDLDEILREISVDGFGGEAEELQSENAALRRDLEEHRNVVRYLRTHLQEMSVLNGKLLYTNKLFKRHNLTNEQKKKVVENFDRAGTMREVKLVYSTLSESFHGLGARRKSSNTKMVTEGLASRPVGSTKPKNQDVIEQPNMLVERFQKIAGITNKNS